jgi:hypothetical protein
VLPGSHFSPFYGTGMSYSNPRLRALTAVALLLLGAHGLHAQEAPSSPVRGDVDGDGRVTAADAQAVRTWLVRGTLPGGRAILPAGDANGDGRVTAVDAALISRFAAGMDVSRFAVGRPVGDGRVSSEGALISTEFECRADTRAQTLVCGIVAAEGAGGARQDVLLYGASAKVALVGGPTYSNADNTNQDTLTYTLALTNLMAQPIGTTDGVNPDTSRLVVTSYVQANAGAQLDNADGTATFVDSVTAGGPYVFPNKQYIDFPGILAQNDTSAGELVRIVYNPVVATLSFKYRIWSRVQYQNGYATVSPAVVPDLNPGSTTTLTGTVYNALGAALGDVITWTSSNTSVATVNASTGEVTAVAVGTATITATSTVNTSRIGTRDVTVTNVNTWEGDVSSDWQTAGNWSANVVPTSTTIAVIPATGTIPNLPVLTADADVLDLTVGAGRTLGLGGFTLQAGGDVTAAGTVSSGMLELSGSDADVQGSVDDVLVSGAGFLSGATNATGPVSVTGSLTVADQALSIAVP